MGKQAWLGEREAISYAAIIYSSLGMEEEKEAFTAGVINIFGSQPRWALLGSCHPLNAQSSHCIGIKDLLKNQVIFNRRKRHTFHGSHLSA